MPGRAHAQPHADYFQVSYRTAKPEVLFTRPADYREYLARLAASLACHPVRLIAYTLMPTHWYLVVGPAVPAALARSLNGVTSTRDGLMVRYHVIPEVDDLFHVCRRVERAALDAGLVRQAQDWPWCSLTNRLHGVNPVPLVVAPFLSSRTWIDYVNDEDVDPAPTSTHWEPRLDDFAQSPGGFA